MARKMWLWVEKLDPKNDWIELSSFHFGSGSMGGGTGTGSARLSVQDATFTLDPGRFVTRLHSWCINGDQRTVWAFFDPQTEIEFSASMATGISTSGHSNSTQVTINFAKMKVDHSGAP